MDIPPKNVHQRVPCIIGGTEEVQEVRAFYAAADDDVKARQQAFL